MSDEKEVLRRVQEGLFHLRAGLTPFVAGRMHKAFGERWPQHASHAAGSPVSANLDAYALLKTMIDLWRTHFEEAFVRNDARKARNFASSALEARNAAAHVGQPLQDEEALRYLDAMHQLLRLAKAPPVEVGHLKRLYDEQRRQGLAAPEIPAAPDPAPAAAPPSRPRLELPTAAAPDGPTAKPLRPWHEVAPPHPDVLANRFKESEFAADLFAVDSGNAASEDYATPAGFFRITFLTEGLRRILSSTLRRLAGAGGDPVIGLQTAFGGGKTHTMLAVYHLARCADLSLLKSVPDLAAEAGVAAWRPARAAVFVGSSKGTDTSLVLKDAPACARPGATSPGASPARRGWPWSPRPRRPERTRAPS